jgi:protein O-GlcNAc transferase
MMSDGNPNPDMMPLQQALDWGIQHQKAGRFPQAEAIYRRILSQQPNNPDALNLLGVTLSQTGQNQLAVELISRAITFNPAVAMYHNNLGVILKTLGQHDAAAKACRQAIHLQPDYADAYNNLGNALKSCGLIAEALDSYRRAIQIQPKYAQAYSNLGNVLKDLGQLDAAVAAYQEALRIVPDYAEAYGNLGVALLTQEKWNQAEEACRKAIRLKPDFAEAYNTLSIVFQRLRQLDRAVDACREALRIKPDYAEAHNNLANALKDQGRIDAAMGEFRAAVQCEPGRVLFHSNLIVALHLHPGPNYPAIRKELANWNQWHAEPYKKFIKPHVNDRDPDRRLKIGYVSADFREHVSAFFLDPLLRSHDHEAFEIFCYAQITKPDHLTRKFQSYADQWRIVAGLNDEQLAVQIRRDDIDILVDLKLHTLDNRLLVFARKPAPIQVTWLGYPGSTGLDTIDYRLTDPWLDPPDLNDEFFSEQSVRLPDCFWCYDPLASEPPVNELPVLKNGYVTFGCLNHSSKVNNKVLELWARMLEAAPNSRILLQAPRGQTRELLCARFQQNQIARERIGFVDFQPRLKYLKLFDQIDVSLDPFPYNGHTTSLDSFWMGVPVVTLVGQTAVGRAGRSILTNIGLPELIANSPQEYVDIAVKLSGDLSRLRELRSALRQRMQISPLMDAKRFALNVEFAYREMWKKWCAGCVEKVES